MTEQDFEVVTGGRDWSSRYTYAPALRAGNLLFISGTTATGDDNQIIGPGDIATQTREILKKFERLLASVGATPAHIVQTVDYITTTENYRKTAEVRREFFKGHRPTATGVVVAGLLRDGALIEISAIAVIPEPAR